MWIVLQYSYELQKWTFGVIFNENIEMAQFAKGFGVNIDSFIWAIWFIFKLLVSLTQHPLQILNCL